MLLLIRKLKAYDDDEVAAADDDDDVRDDNDDLRNRAIMNGREQTLNMTRKHK